MKRKPLTYYLDLISACLRKDELFPRAKRYGENAIKRLSNLSYTPKEEFLLYYRLATAYYYLADHSRATDLLYKAYATVLKHNLGRHYLAGICHTLSNNFLLTGSIDQALNQALKVDRYFQEYGDRAEPMNKRVYIMNLINLAICYMYKNQMDRAEDIFETKIPSFTEHLTDGFTRLNYKHFKGEYLIVKKEYAKASQYFEECIKISRELDYPRGRLEATAHLGIIAILENRIDEAIGILQSLYKDARRIKINSLACESSLLLSKCYGLKNMPRKAESMERRIKPLLKTLDITWFYENRREFERLYSRAQTDTHSATPGFKSVPDVITRTLNQHLETFTYKDIIIGTSPAMQEVYQLIEKIGPADLPVLIQGETGTGKELVAYALRNHSRRRDKSYLIINCTAVPETLLESALFGHNAGAFTGAHTARKGYLESASGGTLFIDEIATMPLTMQPKLLRVLEEKQVWRLGSEKSIPVDVRFIAASNQNLQELVNRNLFRLDLFYRLSMLVINLPPLRERKEDIPLLIEHFLRKYQPPLPLQDKQDKQMTQIIKISPAALDMLVNYPWPGNVRELENEVQRICALHKDAKEIDELMLSENIYNYFVKAEDDKGVSLRRVVDSFERDMIVKALEKHKGNVLETARHLKCPRSYLYRKIKQFRIPTT